MSDRLISREDAETDILAAAAYIGERIASSDGRAEAMIAIVPYMLQRDKVDLAAALADTIDDPYSRDRLLITVAERCVDLGDDEYAQQLADAVEEDALRSRASENVAIKMAAKGDIGGARRLAESVEHPEFVMAAIAARESADGDEEAALATIEGIEFANARVSAYQEMAFGAISANRVDAAMEYLNAAVDAANEIEHDEERIRAVCGVANFYLEIERPELAAETYLGARSDAEALDNQHRDYFLGTCAVGLIQTGDLEKAEETLDLITDKTHMTTAMLAVARDEWKRGERETAAETLDETYEILKSQHERETRDSKARNALMSRIAVQYAGFGNTEKAVEIAEESPDIEEQIAALSQIAKVLVINDDLESSQKIIQRIPDETSRLLAMIAVSDELKKRGRAQEAMSLLDEVAETAAAIDRPVAQSQVLHGTATRYLANEQPEKARRVSIDNLAIIETIRDESSRAASLAALTEIYESGKLDLLDDEKALLAALTAKSAFL